MPRDRVWIFVVALIVAVGVFAGIVARDSQTVSTEVRISARLLESGSVEFALQQREDDGWSDRHLVRARYFHLNTEVGHWLNSGPFRISIEVPAPPQPEADLMTEEEPEPEPEQTTPTPPAEPQEPEVNTPTQTGPPDWRPIPAGSNWINGNYTYQYQDFGDEWVVFQMRRVVGPDPYVACQADTGELHSKTEGGDWSTTTAQTLPALFDFAPWYFAAAAVQEIGKRCGVRTGHLVSQIVATQDGQQQQQRSTTTTVPTIQEPVTRVVSGTATMSNSNHPAIFGTDRIIIRWSSSRPASWSATIRIYDRPGEPIRRVFDPGSITVSVGGRTFTFTVPHHTHGRSVAGYVNRVYPPGTEATLSGSAARDFYCAAKGSSLALSLPMHNPPETHTTTIHIREISPGHGIDLCG